MYHQLFPLKVPSGWAILKHSFGDEDPIVVNGAIVNDAFYSEDLLSIEPLRFDGTSWFTDESGYVLDLGWYPEADPQGCYRLTLLKEDWNHIVSQFESRNRYEIHQLIERCFDLITQGLDEQHISTLLKKFSTPVGSSTAFLTHTAQPSDTLNLDHHAGHKRSPDSRVPRKNTRALRGRLNPQSSLKSAQKRRTRMHYTTYRSRKQNKPSK